MKILSFTILSLILVSCGTRETIKNKYLYSETGMQLLSDQEYYNLEKNAKWPSNDNNFCYISSDKKVVN